MEGLKFDHSSEELELLTKGSIEKSVEVIKKLCEVPSEKRNVENVLIPFSQAEGRRCTQKELCGALGRVLSDQNMKSLCENQVEIIKEFENELNLDTNVYSLLNDVKKNCLKILDEVDVKYIDHHLDAMKRNGLDKEESVQKKVRELRKEIVKAEQQFVRNIRQFQDGTTIEFEIEKLPGVPDDIMKRFKKSEDGIKVKITTKYVDQQVVLMKCSNPSARKKVLDTLNSQCQEENTRLYETAVNKRNQMAKLLGYGDFTEYQLSTRFAKKSENILKMYDAVQKAGNEKLQAELNKMSELKQKEEGSGKLFEHDIKYYYAKFKNQTANLNEDDIKCYFPIDHVVSETVKILGNMFGVVVKKKDDAPKWHKDIDFYELTDIKTKEIVGSFYLDLFSREGKYFWFCVKPVRPSYLKENGERQIGCAVMIANYPSSPKLFSLDHVRIFFHETGHLFHCALSKTKYAIFSGYNVEFDLLEFPSKMIEELSMNKAFLKQVSCHVERKEKIPDELLEKVSILSKLSFRGSATRKFTEIIFGKFDLLSYFQDLEGTKSGFDSRKLFHEVHGELMKDVELNKKTHPGISVHHLMLTNLPYCSGFYSYMWAESIAIDVVGELCKSKELSEEWNKKGILLREKMLEKGGSVDGMKMLTDFLGRIPTRDRFLKSICSFGEK